MKRIDDFIKQHAGLFDSGEPDPGHLERMMNRINIQRVEDRRKVRAMWLRIAAVLLLCTVISFVAFKESGLISKFNHVLSGMPNQELNEAEQYYNSQLSIYYHKIQNLRFNNDQAEKTQVLHELSAMDEQVQIMKHDLIQNPDDERVVHAIISFYQLKIELMDVIIARAQNSTNTIL